MPGAGSLNPLKLTTTIFSITDALILASIANLGIPIVIDIYGRSGNLLGSDLEIEFSNLVVLGDSGEEEEDPDPPDLPEPASVLLLAIGGVALAIRMRAVREAASSK